MKLSVVIPCYNSEKSIKNVVGALLTYVKDYDDFEVILVNDCSRDNTWRVISTMARENTYIKAIDLALNAGQHSAILTGLRYSTGDYVAVIDDDGQTPSSYIPQMIDKINDGWDVVCARYDERGKRSLFRNLGSNMAIRMQKWLLKEPEDLMVTVFFVAKKFVVDEITRYDQPYPYIAGLLLRTTAKITNITMEQRSRLQGDSGYSYRKLLRLWLNGFTAFSIKPLQITSYIGVSASFIGFIVAVITIIRKIIGIDVQLGWSSLLATMLILGGCILLVLGLLGEYVGRIYLSINMTPQGVVRQVVSKDAEE
jgi:undecaprenyl-phosphate 4-deoxy-4-formamido-L-arabinose transferase